MDFVFMLTRQDKTVSDCLDVWGAVAPLKPRHAGFKDIGVPAAVLRELHDRLRASGATTYLEVVSTTDAAALDSARMAVELGVDHLLGGTQINAIMEIIGGSGVSYLPFVGRPEGHPTRLGGTPRDIAEDCRRAQDAGCAGVDLLAYRAYEAPPLALVEAARAALEGTLLVAGSVSTADQVQRLAAAGADAFTIGSAAFEGQIDPDAGLLTTQLRAIAEFQAHAPTSIRRTTAPERHDLKPPMTDHDPPA